MDPSLDTTMLLLYALQREFLIYDVVIALILDRSLVKNG